MPALTSTITVTIGDCPFRNKCTDNGIKCGTCAHSPNRSYYEPYYPYYPYYPQPYSPWWQPWTVTYGDTCTHYEAAK